MANTLRFKRGLASGIPTALAGEPLFTTDTFDLYIGNGTTNTRFQKYIASGATTQILRGDGSLYTFPLAISSPTNGQVLKYNGTSWVNDSDSGITGSGSAGQVAFFTGATTQGGSNNLFWDATNNRLGIGTNTPAYQFHVVRSGSGFLADFQATGGNASVIIERTGTDANQVIINSFNLGGSLTSQGYFRFETGGSERARFTSVGNLLVGTTTDSGQRLQVIGDTLLKGSGNTNATTALTVQDSDGNNTFRVTNGGRLYVGSNGGNQILSSDTNNSALNSGTNLSIVYASTSQAGFGVNFKSSNANQRTYTSGTGGVILLNDGFAPTSGTGTFDFLRFAAIINQTGGANGITRGLYVNPTLTAAADWRSIEWSNNSGWGLYGAGTANNYLRGNTAINTTTIVDNGLAINQNINGSNIVLSVRNDLGSIDNEVSIKMIAGSTNAGEIGTILSHVRQGSSGGDFIIKTGATLNATSVERLRVKNNGNLLIGSTTDSGEKLQVNGTMKVTGASSFGGNMTLSLNQNAATRINVTNTTSGTGSYAELSVTSTNGIGSFIKTSNGYTPYKIFAANDLCIINTVSAGDIAILNDFATGNIKFAAGGSSTAQMVLTSAGVLNVGGTAGAVGTMQVIKTGTSPVSNQLLFGTDGTGYQFAIGKNQAGTITNLVFLQDNGNFGINTAPSERLHVAGNMLISGANSFKMRNLAGTDVNVIRAVTGGTNTLSTATLGNHIAMGTQSGHDFLLCTNDTERIRISNQGWFSHTTATNPSISVTDSYVQYSADVTAGNAAPHFRTENGAVIKLYQETSSVGNAIFSQGGGNSVLDDSTFDGYTIRQIVRALRNQGILQ